MKNSRSNLTLLFLTMLIVNTGFGVIMPVLPYYAQSMGASATILGLLSATYATLQFFFAPLWGRLSDRVGRKPVLLVGLGGFSLSFLVFGLSSQLWMLFAARAIGGLLSSATLPTVLAFIADTTRPEDRAGGMGLMGAAGGIGMIVGPALGGYLGALTPHTPFFFSAGLALVVWIFALTFLPETRPAAVRAAQAPAAGPRRGRFALIAAALRGPLAFLMIVAALTSFGLAQIESTGALFGERRFGAGAAEMGTAFMLMGGLGVFAQFVLVRPGIARFGERRAIQWALLGVGLSFGAIGLAQSYGPILAMIVLFGLSSAFLRPAINALVSREAAEHEQGLAMGVVNSFYSLGMVFGPITGGLIFDQLGVAWPFYSAGLIHFFAAAASLAFFSAPRLKAQAAE